MKIKALLRIIVLGIFYAYWIFIFWWLIENFYLKERRAKRAFLVEKKELLLNWDKNEEKIRSLKNKINEISIIKEFLPFWEKDTFNIKIGSCTENSEIFDLDSFQLLSDYEKETMTTCIIDSILVNKVQNFNRIEDCHSFNSKSKVMERFNDPYNLKIDTLIKMINDSNCQGFWLNETGDLCIQFSGRIFFGSFNYLFVEDGLKNDSLDLDKKIDDDVYWYFYESGLWCSNPIFIEN